MSEAKLIETQRGVVHPWLCDAMGHLTTRHYMAMFDDAAWHFFLSFGFSPREMKRDERGWADVRHEIEYLHEVGVGELVVVRSALVRVGTKSITCKHEMRNAENDMLCATMTAFSVRFDLKARGAIPVEPELRRRMELLLA